MGIRSSASGRIEEIIYAQLESGEDLLEAIWEICREHDITTGQILGGSGALERFRFQHFPQNPRTVPMVIDVVTLEGPLETNVIGTIGTTIVDEDAAVVLAPNAELPTEQDVFTMFGSPYTAGGNRAPYVHAHMTATNSTVTALGHLMPGTIVADMSLGKPVPSHFTLVIAKVTGLTLVNRLAKDGYYHEIVAGDGPVS